MTDDFKRDALRYHSWPTPGKLAMVPTKPLATQRDLALAYSPGVAAACEAIAEDGAQAMALTARGNLVAVISNGTAVLGLGAIGPLAAKPVMEGKAVLFKKFADIDVFDIEVDETDADRLVEVIAALEPTFGAINLEDIKAPECFEVERRLRERMNIPVFHDDQHGTAIVVGAALKNGLRVVDKKIGDIRIVSTGGGAAGIACLDLFVSMGVRPENILLIDRIGVVYTGRREEMDPNKARYAVDTDARGLDEVIDGADVFLGLSAPGILSAEMVQRMAEKPLILALANPEPEILPEIVKQVRPDAVMATGRSDYPNQVNNVLCFPFIFRGALDVGATAINEEMKLACVNALADLALAESSAEVAAAYSRDDLTFGPENLIPKPFDPRLIVEIAPAVARAAMETGVATKPIEDFDAYREQLSQFVFRSGMLMKSVFSRAKERPLRLVYCEGEDERVLRAAQVVVDEGLARPVLVGRPDVVESRSSSLGLRMQPGSDFDLVNPQDDPRYRDYWGLYHELMERRGVSPDDARTIVRTNTTVIGALMMQMGDADAMLCGANGIYDWHLRHVTDVIGLRPGAHKPSALSVLVMPKGTVFLCDTHVTPDPGIDQIVEMTLLAADHVRRFGVAPKVALLSHSNFGNAKSESAGKMRDVVERLRNCAPDLEVEGEMTAEAALNEEFRRRIFPNSRLAGAANLLVLPSLDAANISFNLLKELGDGLPVGPILMGVSRPAHILNPAVSARGIVNMSALAVVDAQLDAIGALQKSGGERPRKRGLKKAG